MLRKPRHYGPLAIKTISLRPKPSSFVSYFNLTRVTGLGPAYFPLGVEGGGIQPTATLTACRKRRLTPAPRRINRSRYNIIPVGVVARTGRSLVSRGVLSLYLSAAGLLADYNSNMNSYKSNLVSLDLSGKFRLSFKI